MTVSVELVVAVADYGAIGYKGDIVWKNKKDLARFKELTTGYAVVMGRKTWESLPRKPLPNRKNVIISSTIDTKTLPDGVVVVKSLSEAISLLNNEEKLFVIGGARLYEEAEKICSKIHLTRVFKALQADTYMPYIDYEKHYTMDILDTFDDYGTSVSFYTCTRK